MEKQGEEIGVLDALLKKPDFLYKVSGMVQSFECHTEPMT